MGIVLKDGKRPLPTFRFGNPGVCTYCGDPAEVEDHVIALAYQRSNLKTSAPHYPKGPMTWACGHCNSLLGSAYFDTFDERCQSIQRKLNERIKPIFWYDWEIEELSHELVDLVKRESHKRRWMQMRADWYGSRDFWLNIENLVWQPCLDSDTPKYHPWLRDYFSMSYHRIKALAR